MSDFIDDFLAGLEEDKQQPRQFEGVEKILMSSRDNQGTIVVAPFMDTNTKKFYQLINGCREYRTTLTNFKDGADEVWVKILPKDLYGELSEAQSKLYDEVIDLFDQVEEELGDISNKWSMIRWRSYSLFQGVIINHIGIDGTKFKDRIGKPALLIFPSRQPINELASAIKSKVVAMNNSKEWIPAVFSPNSKGREGVITITFSKPDSPGYDCNVGFEFNSAYAKVVDPENGFPDEVVNKFGDLVDEFLGWQNGPNSKFNDNNFNELKKIFTVELKRLSVGNPKSIETENKNGVDPMISSSKPTDNVNVTTDGGTGVNLPF